MLGGVKPGMTAFTDETFGPVVAVSPSPTRTTAVELANDTRYGLGATVWSQDTERGERGRSSDRLRRGLGEHARRVRPRLPFGGIKRSGYGRELAAAACTSSRTSERTDRLI